MKIDLNFGKYFFEYYVCKSEIGIHANLTMQMPDLCKLFK